ncbi:hypothetical protein [Pontibacillus salipaludis]|uniref:Uncharacterized protein n=1 Tax=Pontibacillus salipaludis TaxID=1697394 RepID=A0ABQ1PX30_9BACI|nr:hypothetical protein [Pontibacillus salipaludis]GGD05412.1 hypothetical protein GCM10011389_11160 [Pontibacillus salipaludis]
MSARFEVDYSEVERLQRKFSQLPGDVERVLNDVLHSYGVENVKDNIKIIMPVSKKEKKHAKNYKSLRHEEFNLGFIIHPKPKYNYLVFPDKALGTSVDKDPDEFMQTGLDASIEHIFEQINEEVERLLREEF